MLKEEVVGLIVLCGILLLMPVFVALLYKAVEFVGDRLRLFKKYCVKDGKQVGREQLEKVYGDWNVKFAGVGALVVLSCCGLFLLLDHWFHSAAWSYVGLILGAALILFVVFMNVNKCLT